MDSLVINFSILYHRKVTEGFSFNDHSASPLLFNIRNRLFNFRKTKGSTAREVKRINDNYIKKLPKPGKHNKVRYAICIGSYNPLYS